MDFTRADIKRKRQVRRATYVVAVVGVTAALFYLIANLDPLSPSVDRNSVYVGTVDRGEMLLQVRGTGTFVPRDVRWLDAVNEARVEEIYVKPGVPVEPDTLLVKMSNPQLEQQVAEAAADVAAAEADYAALQVDLQSELLDQRTILASAKADFEAAKFEYEAQSDLAAKGIVSAIDHRRAELAAEQFEVRYKVEQERIDILRVAVDAKLEAAKFRLAQQRQELQSRQEQYANLELRAGFHGVLQVLDVEVGQLVTPGTHIARVARVDELIAELRVAETQAKDVQLNQSVEIDTRTAIVRGLVTRIDPTVQNGTVQIDVELVDALPSGARPDMSVVGTILIERLDDVLHVSRPTYGQANSTLRMFRLEQDSQTAVRVPVELGRLSVNRVQIIDGLEEGDQVVLSDMSQWSDHDKIELN